MLNMYDLPLVYSFVGEGRGRIDCSLADQTVGKAEERLCESNASSQGLSQGGQAVLHP